MTPPFSVRTSPHFDRLAEALTRRQPDFPARYDRAREILGRDPYNRTRRHGPPLSDKILAPGLVSGPESDYAFGI